MITQLKLRLSNAYLIQEARSILVDTGAPGEHARIQERLAEHGLRLADLALILHTHAHSDHVGSTAALVAHAAVPTALHGNDLGHLRRATNGQLTGVGLRGRIMAGVFNNAAFTPFVPAVVLEDGMRLDAYGVAGQVLHTPGHTPGSISILLDSGAAIVGDVLMGGYLGGNLLPGRPMPHYFAEDAAQAYASLQRVLAHRPHILYVGHGGPLSVARLPARWTTP